MGLDINGLDVYLSTQKRALRDRGEGGKRDAPYPSLA